MSNNGEARNGNAQASAGPPVISAYTNPWQKSPVTRQNIWSSSGDSGANSADLLCFSHLRWDFVFQRPQHLLTRCSKERRVFYIEEPIYDDSATSRLDVTLKDSGVFVCTPYMSNRLSESARISEQAKLVRQLLKGKNIDQYVCWYYTPMAFSFTEDLAPAAIVYDCMDELCNFKNAPESIGYWESELLRRADVVFTGGQSLYEHKRSKHKNIHPFPSSIDVMHFGKAKNSQPDPEDQANIPHKRIGFFGVIDERFDIELLDSVASARPDWHFVILGPVVKIDPDTLPKYDNIHYLGSKPYEELPCYIAGWDAAVLLFARNDATRFISPTKTPEYLAAGKPVVSTSIRDVVRPYERMKLVQIADEPEQFIQALESAMTNGSNYNCHDWQSKCEQFLASNSWDRTWHKMSQLIEIAVSSRLHARERSAVAQSASAFLNSVASSNLSATSEVARA